MSWSGLSGVPENVASLFFERPLSLLMATYSIPHSKVRIDCLVCRVSKSITVRIFLSSLQQSSEHWTFSFPLVILEEVSRIWKGCVSSSQSYVLRILLCFIALTLQHLQWAISICQCWLRCSRLLRFSFSPRDLYLHLHLMPTPHEIILHYFQFFLPAFCWSTYWRMVGGLYSLLTPFSLQ